MGPSVRWLLPVAVVATTSSAAMSPPSLHGRRLAGDAALRLLVPSDPPLVADVDTGRITRIRGLRLGDSPTLSVLAVGQDAVVWVARRARGTPRADVYVVRRGSAKATRLTTAWEVAPTADGRAVWLKAFTDARRCTLRELALDGHERQRVRQVPCSTRLIDAGRGGLLVQGSSVVDPGTKKTLLRTAGVWAIANHFALTGNSHSGLVLTDLRTNQRWRLRWPSRVGGPSSQGGVDQAVVASDGRHIAVSFSDPAWQGGGTQVTDVWLLDPSARRFRHLPGFPAAVSLKFTSMSWTSNQRLVILARTANQDVLGIWRPGERQLEVRRLRLPPRDSGSDSFVVWARNH